ncbi:MAG: succinylglutamate desuccinylase/aspartoacylase family protein, partial [Desulfobacterales bacterium]
MRPPVSLAGSKIKPGRQATIQVPVARLYTHTEMTMPVHVIHGYRDGPRLFVSAAIHGDEIIGTEIIRRLMKLKKIKKLRGTLIAVPVVNVYGFLQQSRYSPDRRDLNRF